MCLGTTALVGYFAAWSFGGFFLDSYSTPTPTRQHANGQNAPIFLKSNLIGILDLYLLATFQFVTIREVTMSKSLLIAINFTRDSFSLLKKILLPKNNN